MTSDWQSIINDFKFVVPSVDFWSLRLVLNETETLNVREGVVQSPNLAQCRGAHISFIDRGGMAYAATSALTREGLKAACEQALHWLDLSRRHALIDIELVPRPQRSGHYASTVATPWDSWGLQEKLKPLPHHRYDPLRLPMGGAWPSRGAGQRHALR